jgi:hypothetical protein
MSGKKPWRTYTPRLPRGVKWRDHALPCELQEVALLDQRIKELSDRINDLKHQRYRIVSRGSGRGRYRRMKANGFVRPSRSGNWQATASQGA